MLDNAQMIYAEIIQLNDVAIKHQRNCEFWQIMLEAHVDEKPLYLDDMGSYRRSLRRIKHLLKRNKKALKRAQYQSENLKGHYQKVTGLPASYE